ncbi:hypothetical protein [Martelella mangrovi]|uniref:Uncharacterized protein n=1 Tax=Martelella mangrovi TaxID=1397477 RepID=A0ABV2IH10_9HYPH
MSFQSFIRKILLKAITADERRFLSADNTPTPELPWTPGGENTVQDILDAVGLPWRNTTEEIIARYGLTHHQAYERKQSPIEPCPLGLDGLIYPLSPEFGAFYNRDQVPLSFSAVLWGKHSPIANIEHAEHQLSKLLGNGHICKRWNTYDVTWRSGPASISATVWPEWYQDWPAPNPAHERDKRLQSACTIRVQPGYRRPMSDQEREQLRSFTPFARSKGLVAPDTLEKLWSRAPDTTAQDYIRLPPTDQDNFLRQIGFSGDGRSMIICGGQLHIVPLEHITGFTLFKLLPAKGPGGAGLSLTYRPPGVNLERDRTIGLMESCEDMDDLDEVTYQLSERVGRPVTCPEPQYDC